MGNEPQDTPIVNPVDRLGTNLLTAITAVIEFGRGTYPPDLFEKATLKALVYAQAALITGGSDPINDANALDEAALALTAAVADYRHGD